MSAFFPGNGRGRGSRIGRGFTLIELMIVVLIIAILSSIAFASYQQYIIRSNRSKAISALNKAAYEQERFLYSFGQYASNLTNSRQGSPPGLGLLDTTLQGPQDNTSAYYLIALNLCGNLCYTLTATPKGAVQSKDTCGSLVLASTGQKTAARDGCW